MNMFARFDENPAMTLRVIKETKRYGRTDGRTDGQRENSIPPTNKVCGGYNDFKFEPVVKEMSFKEKIYRRGTDGWSPIGSGKLKITILHSKNFAKSLKRQEKNASENVF